MIVKLTRFAVWLQKDLSAELASRTKAERHKQDEVKVGSAKRKANAQAAQQVSPPNRSGKPKKSRSHGNSTTPPGASAASSANRIKKEKLYCLCRTPYDETKYVFVKTILNINLQLNSERKCNSNEFVCTDFMSGAIYVITGSMATALVLPKKWVKRYQSSFARNAATHVIPKNFIVFVNNLMMNLSKSELLK